MNPELTKLIERYLNGELTPTEKAELEQKMNSNEVLRKEVELQRMIHEAANRLSVRTQIKSAGKAYHLLRKAIFAGIVVLSIAIGTGVIYLTTKKSSKELDQEEQETLQTLLDKSAPIDNLKTHYFQWKGNDTVFVSPNGVLLSVPENAYKHAKGETMTLQYQEAMDIQDIVKSGLSTMSGDQLLETQGMFGVQAFNNKGKRLDINPEVGVYVQVPVDEVKKGMMLFEGKKTKDGIIDWQNPTKLEKLPTLAKMSDLNFYPPGYEDTLNNIKAPKDKKYRDSLYLSMEEFLGGETKEVRPNTKTSSQPTINKVEIFSFVEEEATFYGNIQEYVKMNIVYPKSSLDKGLGGTSYLKFVVETNGEITNVQVSKGVPNCPECDEEALRVVKTMPNWKPGKNKGKPVRSYCGLPVKFEVGNSSPNPKNSSSQIREKKSGKVLFETKCSTCHSLHRNSTGPDLFGVRNKWAQGGAKPGSIYKWVNNWQSTTASDPYAQKVSMWAPTASQNFPELNTEQIDAIFDYIDGCAIANDTVSPSVTAIPPSKVLAFWNKKFDKTNLATRDFEKRTRAIHKTCDPKLLDLYTKNLDKALWELDEKAVKMGYKEFQVFADEHLGKVELSNEHQENLSKYYEKLTSELRKDAKEVFSFRLKKENEWDKETTDKRLKNHNENANRNNKNLQQETEVNMESVYKQLGKKRPEYRAIAGPSVGFRIITNVSTHNIDAFVREQTYKRESGTFYDKDTKKTAKIIYNKMKLKVQEKGYERLYVYLFPSKLSSFHRLTPISKNSFEYTLNGEMQYDLAIVGFKDDGYYFYSKKMIPATDLGEITLEKVSEKKLNASLESMNHSRTNKNDDITDEIKFLVGEQQDYVVQKQRQKVQLFRERIRKVVFPCITKGSEYVPSYEIVEDVTL